jgi:hypothetical protein
MLPARVRSGPREHQGIARSDEVSGSTSRIDYRCYVLEYDRVDNNRYDARTIHLGPEVLVLRTPHS